MHQDLFFEAISQLPEADRTRALALLNEHPELTTHLRENFNKKLEAARDADVSALSAILEDEKKYLETLLNNN